MQVLVKNPYCNQINPNNVVPSFWSPDCLFLGPAFSMTSLMDVSSAVGPSPFLVLDARIAFLISQLEKSTTLATRYLGPLGAVGSHIFSGARITHNEDAKKFDRYAKEFLPMNILAKDQPITQVIAYNESIINQQLWDQMPVGSFYLLASAKEPLIISPLGTFEAVSMNWDMGMPTEFGWRFFEEEGGLEHLEYVKLKKLS